MNDCGYDTFDRPQLAPESLLGIFTFMQLSKARKRTTAGALKPDALGVFGLFMLGNWVVVSLLLTCSTIEPYLLLVYFYGFSRVHKEGLHFTYTPSSKSADDYIVSNGDQIGFYDALIVFPIVVVVWLALILIGYLVIRRFSRWRNEAHWKKLIKGA